MDLVGPPLEELTHRLAETPEDFRAEPRIGASGAVDVAAVVRDFLERVSARAIPLDLAPFTAQAGDRDRGRLSFVLVVCWLLDTPWFQKQALDWNALLATLTEVPRELAAHGDVTKLLADAERREELARVALARLGYRPAGETRTQAQDRLQSISASERTRLLAASRAAEERARKIREELARKAAQEAADKWTRE